MSKISQYENAEELNGSELFPLVQDGVTKNISAGDLQGVQSKIVELGTITFEDLNNAPAAIDIELPLNGEVPDGWYVDAIYWEHIQFDSLLQTYHQIYSPDADLTLLESFYLTQNTGLKIAFPNHLQGANAQTVRGFSDAYIYINFDQGNGEVNPQNATVGSATFKVLIKKFPVN